MLNNKTVLRIISLIAAVCLWIYVMGEVDPETKAKINGIPVTYANSEALADRGLAAVLEDDMYISAVINGKRSDVNYVKKSGLTAVIDVSDCDEGKQTGKITVNTPDGISLESVSATTMSFDVEEIVWTEKPVKIKFSGTKSTGDKVEWAIDTSPEVVTVFGPKSSVDRVKFVTGFIDAKDVSSTKAHWRTVSIVPVTKFGRLVRDVVLYEDVAKAKVQNLTKKEVELQVTADGLNEDFAIEELKYDKKIQIVGAYKDIENIEAIEGVADLSAISEEDYTGGIPVKVQLPDKVYLLNGDGSVIVKVVIKAAR